MKYLNDIFLNLLTEIVLPGDPVNITQCNEPPCMLKKGRQVTITQKFVTDHDVQNLVTSVYAIILNIPLPFIGVNGKSACDKIYTLDGNRASCPVKKDQVYMYKNTFDILPSYPVVSK